MPVDNAGSLSERKPTPLPANPDTAVRNWAAVGASIAALVTTTVSPASTNSASSPHSPLASRWSEVPYSGRTTIDKVVAVTMPIALFVASGFEHCVANMFLLPLAILIQAFSPEAFWLAVGHSAGQFAALDVGGFLNNLLPATLGNIVGGGCLVGWVQWSLHAPKRVRRPVE